MKWGERRKNLNSIAISLHHLEWRRKERKKERKKNFVWIEKKANVDHRQNEKWPLLH